MKNISLHTPSVLAGFGVAALVAITLGQQIVGTPGVEILRVVEPVVAHQPAHPKNFVRIDEGAPFTVPSDRLLVVTGVGNASVGIDPVECYIHINGVRALGVRSGGTAVASLPDPGLVASPGSVVEPVRPPNSKGPLVLFGYLAEDD